MDGHTLPAADRRVLGGGRTLEATVANLLDVHPLTRPHAPVEVNSMWALCDFTEENGATRLIPVARGRGRPTRGRP